MSKQIAYLLNEMAHTVYGYPKQVATIDADDRLLIEVDNRYVESLLEEAHNCLLQSRPPFIPNPDQLSFDM